MNPGRFFMPNMAMNPMMMRYTNMASRGPNIFSKIISNISKVNFGKILNGANKTLNVMNQTIPLIRQAGPMINNAKSMLHLVKAFKTETNTGNIKRNTNINNIIKNTDSIKKTIISKSQETINNNNNFPTFFL